MAAVHSPEVYRKVGGTEQVDWPNCESYIQVEVLGELLAGTSPIWRSSWMFSFFDGETHRRVSSLQFYERFGRKQEAELVDWIRNIAWRFELSAIDDMELKVRFTVYQLYGMCMVADNEAQI